MSNTGPWQKRRSMSYATGLKTDVHSDTNRVAFRVVAAGRINTADLPPQVSLSAGGA